MAQTPVTILLAVKNYRRDYLVKAVGSIWGQRCPEWRLMVIAERGAEEDVWDVVGKPDGARIELITNQGRGLRGRSTRERRGRRAHVRSHAEALKSAETLAIRPH